MLALRNFRAIAYILTCLKRKNITRRNQSMFLRENLRAPNGENFADVTEVREDGQFLDVQLVSLDALSSICFSSKLAFYHPKS